MVFEKLLNTHYDRNCVLKGYTKFRELGGHKFFNKISLLKFHGERKEAKINKLIHSTPRGCVVLFHDTFYSLSPSRYEMLSD